MIYFIQAEGIGHIKIGFTDGEDAATRLGTLQVGCPVPLRVLHTMPGTLEDEKNLHRKFAAAGVGGEWFKPVPELLALIPAADVKRCEGVEIAERSVTIRVLTVGRKQFTKILLGQLPQSHSVDWDLACEEITHTEAEHFDYTPFLRGNIWGWVNPGPSECDAVIFDRAGKLFRDDRAIPQWVQRNLGIWRVAESDGQTATRSHSGQDYADAVWAILCDVFDLPGWRREDQLFIGV